MGNHDGADADFAPLEYQRRIDTRHDLVRRKTAKLALLRDALRSGYTGDELRRLFDIAERFLNLPRAEYAGFRATLATEIGAQAVEIT